MRRKVLAELGCPCHPSCLTGQHPSPSGWLCLCPSEVCTLGDHLVSLYDSMSSVCAREKQLQTGNIGDNLLKNYQNMETSEYDTVLLEEAKQVWLCKMLLGWEKWILGLAD